MRFHRHYGLTGVLSSILTYEIFDAFGRYKNKIIKEGEKNKRLNEDCLARHGYTLDVKRAEESVEYDYIAGTGFSALGLIVGLLGKSIPIQHTTLRSVTITLGIVFAIIGVIMYYISYTDATARKRYYKNEKEYKEYDERFR